MFYICFSKNSSGQGLRNWLGEMDHVTFLNRTECCERFNVEDGDDNIKIMEHIIREVPSHTALLFDEVPLTSKLESNKASYDWSSLENKRPEEVSVVVSLQPSVLREWILEVREVKSEMEIWFTHFENEK